MASQCSPSYLKKLKEMEQSLMKEYSMNARNQSNYSLHNYSNTGVFFGGTKSGHLSSGGNSQTVSVAAPGSFVRAMS